MFCRLSLFVVRRLVVLVVRCPSFVGVCCLAVVSIFFVGVVSGCGCFLLCVVVACCVLAISLVVVCCSLSGVVFCCLRVGVWCCCVFFVVCFCCRS